MVNPHVDQLRLSGAVVVVGSLNMDVSVRVERHPLPGETVLASSSTRSGGGKGANQAVAAARAGGARTVFVGAVGDDEDGRALRRDLETDGIEALLDTVAEPTGMALITVDADGENSIVVLPGANALVSVGTDEVRSVLGAADVILLQLEIPSETVVAAARLKRPGARVVLNAAPSGELSQELCDLVDVVVVNEHEAADLAGVGGGLDAIVAALLLRVPAVVVTLGSSGSVYQARGEGMVTVAASRAQVIDTTAAGDTFCGVLAAELAVGRAPGAALELASTAAAIAVGRAGAQVSIPSMEEVRMRHAEQHQSPPCPGAWSGQPLVPGHGGPT